MIDTQILEFIDIGDAIPTLDIYSKTRLIKFFNYLRIMNNYKPESMLFILFCKFFYFFQFLIIPLINTPEEEKNADSLIKIINYIKKLIFVQDIINDKKSYIIILSFCIVICLLIIFLLIYLIISYKNIKKYPMVILNFLNFIFQHVLLFILINTFLLSTKCMNGKHIYLNIKCWKSTRHIILCFISILFMSFSIFYSALLSLYTIQIGGIKSIHFLTAINSNYKIVVNILSIFSYGFSYFVEYYTDRDNEFYTFFNKVFVLCISLSLLTFGYKYVYYYNNVMNFTVLFGWSFIAWYCFGTIFKIIFYINDIILFVLIGWCVISYVLYIYSKYRIEYFLTQINILEVKTVKEIEMFVYNFLLVASNNSIESKTLLIGLIQSLREFFSNNNEIYEKLQKFENNEIMIQKFGGNNSSIFQVYNIIYLIYDYYINKSELKDDVLLLFCYFLINKLKNISYAFYLCTKIKINKHKLSFLKYILMEELKEHLINKITKNSSNKETIKYVQFGSLILYNTLIDSFKLKIYDAACNQIEYFDILRNTTTSPKVTNNFLILGEKIINLRKDIIKIWNKIIELNPFSDENEKDYMLYLETIIKDEELARKESKRYNQIKLSKLIEKNNIYHSLFIKEICSIVLFDGISLNCKIIYTTPNFPILFNYLPKELILMNIEDLLPTCVSYYHNELISNTLRYSNLSFIFNKKFKNCFLKSKSNGLYNINVYVKCLPNLSNGIIYISVIEKINENQFLIILDSDFKINAMTEQVTVSNETFYSILNDNNSFGLNQNILNHHIGIIIPEILKQIKFENNKFTLIKNDIDLKGILYPNINEFSHIENEVDLILEKIKQNGRLMTDEYINLITNKELLSRSTSKTIKKESNLKEYNDLIGELNGKYNNKTYSIFYNLIKKSFLNDKYIYYRLYITNDILGSNDYNNNFKCTESPKVENIINQINRRISVDSVNHATGIKERVIKLKINGNEFKQNIDKYNTNNFNNIVNMINENKENNDINNANIQEKISHSSLTTHASIDSAIFNKLKSKILEKNEPFFIIHLKFFSILYIIITIILIYFSNISMKNRFTNTYNFINQNYFFNSSKVFVSCIYLSGLNLKFLKYNMMNRNDCFNTDCLEVYMKILEMCLNTIENSTNDLINFDIDYKNILSKDKEIDIYVYSLNFTHTISIHNTNLLHFILSNGIKIISHIESYLREDNDTIDSYEENLLNCSFNYIHDIDIHEFRNNIKQEKLNQTKFRPNYYYYIINVFLFVFISAIFIFVIFKVHSIEKYFLKKLIWYHSNNFDNYIKYLDELKKKLRSEPDDDDDKILQNDSNENQNNIENESEKSYTKKFQTKKKESNSNIKDDKLSIKKKTKKKKKLQGRYSKMHQQKKEKIHIMGTYFLLHNILNAIKLVLILSILTIFYIIMDTIYKKRKKDFILLDNIMSEIYGIFNESCIKYSLMKNQTSHYLEYNIMKEKYIKELLNDYISNITINSITYTKNDIDLLNETKYELIIPTLEEISIPKIGNILTSFFSKNENGKSNNPYSQLYRIYYGDLCQFLYIDDEILYNNCINFWSAILKRGLEQTITQFSIELNSLLDEFISINKGEKTLKEINNYNGTLGQIEIFINFFFLNSFVKTREYYKSIMKDKLNDFSSLINIMFIFIIICIPIIFFFIIIFIYSIKRNLTCFLNFIGILPIQYLSEDENFYRDILKLEGEIFES